VTGENVSGLKLTYTAKTGLFKGSLMVYTMRNSKLLKNKFSVFGAVTGGVGYGTAVLKGKRGDEHRVNSMSRVEPGKPVRVVRLKAGS